MVNTKKVRLFAALVAVMMIVAMLPVVSSAAGNTIVITSATHDAETNVVTVVGKIADDSGAGIAGQVTLLATMQAGQIEESSALLTLEEGKIAYINQVTANDDGTFTFQFLPMEGVTGKYMTVFVGGTGVEPIGADNIRNIEMPAAIGKAGTITAKEATNINGNAIEFTVNAEAADEGWVDIIAENAAVYDGETEVSEASVAYAEGTLTITGLALPADVYEKEYKLVVSGAEAFADVELTFNVVSTVKLVADMLPASIAVAYDAANEGADLENGAAEIAEPVIANEYGITPVWSFVTDATGVTASEEGVTASETPGYTWELARGAEKNTYYYKVVIEKAGENPFSKVYTISVNAEGETGPSFTAENVAITSVEGGVYGKAGKAVVTVTHAEVDGTSTVKVGETALYYSPERGKFVGIVDTASAEDIAAAITVVEGESTKLYYGKVTIPNEAGDIGNGDVSRALGILKGTLAEPTDAQLLAADVLGVGSVGNGAVSRILGVLKGTGTREDFTVIEPAE